MEKPKKDAKPNVVSIGANANPFKIQSMEESVANLNLSGEMD